MERGTIIVISVIIVAIITALAIAYYQRTVPTDINAVYVPGVSLFHSGKYKEAITYFDKALTIDPANQGCCPYWFRKI